MVFLLLTDGIGSLKAVAYSKYTILSAIVCWILSCNQYINNTVRQPAHSSLLYNVVINTQQVLASPY